MELFSMVTPAQLRLAEALMEPLQKSFSDSARISALKARRDKAKKALTESITAHGHESPKTIQAAKAVTKAARELKSARGSDPAKGTKAYDRKKAAYERASQGGASTTPADPKKGTKAFERAKAAYTRASQGG